MNAQATADESSGRTGPVVTTTSGRVRGLIDPLSKVRTWRGVPYGADTSGPHRFRAPRSVPSWPGIKDCTEYAPPALQGTYGLTSKVIGSENCLTVDIVRPDTDEELPVVVYFHGGSFLMGSSHEKVLQGHNLAVNTNVVYVSVNFRLGVLGYLDLRSVGPDCVANPALRDQILSLRWIKRNIAAFGGNPNSVTIMGESAGGASVVSLMIAPSARGLFHRAIAQSPPVSAVHTRIQAAMWASTLLDYMGMSRLSTLDDLRAVEGEELVRVGQAMIVRGRELMYLNSSFMPTVDGETLTQHPIDAFNDGNEAPVPFIIGTNSDEASFAKALYLRMSKRSAAARRILEVFDAENADRVLKAYGMATERKEFAALLADAVFWAPSVSIASAHRHFAPTWMYRFDYANETMQRLGLGAMHSSDLAVVFGAPGVTRASRLDRFGSTEGFEDVSTTMQYHWGHFFHFGRPGEEWPRYATRTDTEPGRATAIFDSTAHVVYDPRQTKRRAWESFRMTQWGDGRIDVEERLADFLGLAANSDE
ncbi:carboxylesterase/lipase family protein [Corynebacterium breve]|uniref:Carboxylic ester hydrolase n=1 Tax=Corynebacterium breve TaxID=3049799 RepID=A0ABY8VHN8_9CORY|nr:carboxylesterase/lipase family protein [Corynebacterium breve]WIM68582.1 carboxylesterase/lipase family protein [Corynebacterium breve]